MRRLVAGLGVLTTCLAAACGGNVAGGSRDPEEEGQTENTDEPAATPKDGTGRDNPEADTELGECIRGPNAADYAQRCAWVADNLCYQTREMACNCSCPRARNSQCVSGFEAGEYGRVVVTCN